MKILTFILIGLFFVGFFSIAFAQEKQVDFSSICIIPIHGEINKTMVVFVSRGIANAQKQKANIIIFDINTFGGRVDSALQITTLIGSAEPAMTIAYVTTIPQSTGVSWSAGALISFSCNRIYMSPGTSIGACAPISVTPQGSEMASEKVVSAIRAQISSLAEKNGYPKSIAQAMVDEDIEVREIFVDDKILAVTDEELKDIERESKKSGQKIEKGKIISPSGKLLTLTAKEMERYGVSSGTVKNRDQLYKALEIEKPDVLEFEQSTADKIVAIITGSIFTSILITIGLMTLFIELTSPGFGIPGTIAIICFSVVFSSYALLGTVGSIELIMFVIGVVLLILEIFIIPGFGIAGISGIVLIVSSLVLSMQGFVLPGFDWQKEIFKHNILIVSISVVASFIAFTLFAYYLPKFKPFSRLTLETTQSPEQGFTVQSKEMDSQLVGKKGIAITTLRPSGKAEIDNQVIAVETDGEFLVAGESVEIIEVSGNRIIVRKC